VAFVAIRTASYYVNITLQLSLRFLNKIKRIFLWQDNSYSTSCYSFWLYFYF